MAYLQHVLIGNECQHVPGVACTRTALEHLSTDPRTDAYIYMYTHQPQGTQIRCNARTRVRLASVGCAAMDGRLVCTCGFSVGAIRRQMVRAEVLRPLPVSYRSRIVSVNFRHMLRMIDDD